MHKLTKCTWNIKCVFIPSKDGTSPNICKISIIIRDKNASIFTKYNMYGDFLKKNWMLNNQNWSTFWISKYKEYWLKTFSVTCQQWKKKFVTNINSAAVILVSECVYRNTALIYKEVQCLKSKQTCAGILFQPIDQYFRL